MVTRGTLFTWFNQLFVVIAIQPTIYALMVGEQSDGAIPFDTLDSQHINITGFDLKAIPTWASESQITHLLSRPAYTDFDGGKTVEYTQWEREGHE